MEKRISSLISFKVKKIISTSGEKYFLSLQITEVAETNYFLSFQINDLLEENNFLKNHRFVSKVSNLFLFLQITCLFKADYKLYLWGVLAFCFAYLVEWFFLFDSYSICYLLLTFASMPFLQYTSVTGFSILMENYWWHSWN